jgi:PTH2 family peptidyl-tRNA hydrolase
MKATACLAFGAGVATTLLIQRLTRSSPDRVSIAYEDDDDIDEISEDSSDENIEVASSGAAAVEALGWRDGDAPLKMLLCVNVDLRDASGKSVSMTKGKTCAQCGHATLGAYRKALTSPGGRNAVRIWLRTGQMKIAVRVPTQAELTALHAEAAHRGLVCSLVRDAGHTQIAPGSRTVLAVGPAPERYFDFTKHLKLL